MEVEFKQIPKDEDFINFGIRYYFAGDKKKLVSTFIFPAIGLILIIWHFLSNAADNFLLIIGVLWLFVPVLRYYSIRKH